MMTMMMIMVMMMSIVMLMMGSVAIYSPYGSISVKLKKINK